MKIFAGFQKGVNLGGWLSQCDYSQERLNGFIREKDFQIMSSFGLEHVRLPFDFNLVQSSDGKRFLEEGFQRIARAVEWSRKYGLNIILDLHKCAGFSFDPGEKEQGFFEKAEYQERFYLLWEEMARRFGHDPEHVAFELLNEVTDQAYSPIWNRVAKTCVERVRAIAGDVFILIGSYWNNHASAVKDLDEPYDARVVYNFHCYDPLFFTHQGASWVHEEGFDQSRRMSFEESGVNEAYFESLFADAVRKAEENDTALYCGEYGVIALADPSDLMKWYRTIHSVFEKYSIGRAAWTYKKMDFDLFGENMSPYLPELATIL